jgi:hypothetical protein
MSPDDPTPIAKVKLEIVRADGIGKSWEVPGLLGIRPSTIAQAKPNSPPIGVPYANEPNTLKGIEYLQNVIEELQEQLQALK